MREKAETTCMASIFLCLEKRSRMLWYSETCFERGEKFLDQKREMKATILYSNAKEKSSSFMMCQIKE
jgi:hypothetical protein